MPTELANNRDLIETHYSPYGITGLGSEKSPAQQVELSGEIIETGLGTEHAKSNGPSTAESLTGAVIDN